MIKWIKKIYAEGPWGFWSIIFLFPIPLFVVLLEVFILKLDFEINYGWFFAPVVLFGLLHQRDERKKK